MTLDSYTAQFRAGMRLMVAWEKSGLTTEQFAAKLQEFALSPAAVVLPNYERMLLEQSPEEFVYSLLIPYGRAPSRQLLPFIARILGVSYESLAEDNPEATRAFFKEKVREIKERRNDEEQTKRGSPPSRVLLKSNSSITRESATPPPKQKTELWQRIRYARELAGYTVERVSQEMRVPIGKVRSWESPDPQARKEPSSIELEIIAEGFDVPWQWLISSDGQLRPPARLNKNVRLEDMDWSYEGMAARVKTKALLYRMVVGLRITIALQRAGLNFEDFVEMLKSFAFGPFASLLPAHERQSIHAFPRETAAAVVDQDGPMPSEELLKLIAKKVGVSHEWLSRQATTQEATDLISEYRPRKHSGAGKGLIIVVIMAALVLAVWLL